LPIPAILDAVSKSTVVLRVADVFPTIPHVLPPIVNILA
jgi:hypothetical protein